MDDSGGQQPDQSVALLTWSSHDVAHGKLLKGEGRPQDSKLKLFRVLVSAHRMNYLVPNELAPDDMAAG